MTAEWDPAEHPRDPEGKFAEKPSVVAERRLRNPKTDDDITDETVKLLPPEAREDDEGAERVFRRRLHDLHDRGDLIFYHESPGNVEQSMRRHGIFQSYGVFASIGQPSEFVTSSVKTVVRFTVPRAMLKYVGADMKYGWSEKLGTHQMLLLNEPDDLKGTYVSYPDRIPPAWIKDVQVVRRQQETGWAWGQDRLTPLYHIKPTEGLGDKLTSLPRRDLPALVVGAVRPPAPATLAEAQDRGGPDHVLLRPAGPGWEVLTEAGWRKVRPHRAPASGRLQPPATHINVSDGPKVNPRWIETSRGFALDGPEAPAWDPEARRLPLDLLERWPAMRGVALPAARPGEWYAVRVAPPVEAEAMTLGQALDAGAWALDRTLEKAVRRALAGRPMADPVLVLATLSEPTWDVPYEALQVVVALAEGRVVYARDPFPAELGAPYRRVAVVALEPQAGYAAAGRLPGRDAGVWAVRPRGRSFWALPGGHINPGEAPAEAAAREMAEETGAAVQVVRSLGFLHRPWSSTEVFLAHRVGRPQDPESLDEIDAVQVIPLEWLESGERGFVSRQLPAFHQAEAAAR